MDRKYLFGMLFVICTLFIAVGSAYADNVQKCGDCVESKDINTSLSPNNPSLFVNKTNTTTARIEVDGTIEFRINISNQGENPAYYVVVYDFLPSTMTYVEGSQRVEGNDALRKTSGYGFSSGNNGRNLMWDFDDLSEGSQGYIYFTAKSISNSTLCEDNIGYINGTYRKDRDGDGLLYYIGFSGESGEIGPNYTTRQNNQNVSFVNENNGCINITPKTTISVTKVANSTKSYEVCEPMNYEITVTQTGAEILPVNINDTFESTCNFVNTSTVLEGAAWNESNKSYTYYFENVLPLANNITRINGHFNGTSSYNCTNTVKVNGTIQVSPYNKVNATTTEEIHVKYPDMTIEKTREGTESIGGNITYTITIKNIGDGKIINLTINDTLPYHSASGGLQITANSITSSTGCIGFNWTIRNDTTSTTKTLNVFNNITVEGGQTCTITYNVTVPSGYNTALGYTNKACMQSGKDNCGRNITDHGIRECDESTSVAAAVVYDVSVNKTANNTNLTGQNGKSIVAQAGDIINYTVKIKNSGSVPINNIVLSDFMFSGNQGFIRGGKSSGNPNPGSGTQCDRDVISSHTLDPGAEIICWYTVNVTCDAMEGAHLNQIELDITYTDNGRIKRSDIAVVYVKKPKLMIEKWTNVDTISPDGTVTVHVRVKNIGSGNATEILINDTGFHGTNTTQYFNYSTATSLGPECNDLQTVSGTGTNHVPPQVRLSGLAGNSNGKGQSCEYSYTAQADHNTPEPVLYTNIVTLSYNDTNSTHCALLNQTAVAHVYVTSDVTLSVIKEAIEIRNKTGGTTDPRTGGINSHAEPSDFVLYRIVVTNTGNNNIHNVTLVDQIPDGWELANATSCGRNNNENYWGTIGTAGNVTTTTVDDLMGTETIYLCLHITSDASCGPTENKVVANATAPDGRYLEDSDKARPIEVIKPHLMIEKWTTDRVNLPGDNVTYKIRIKNVGCNDINVPSNGTKGTAENIVVRDYLAEWLIHNNNGLGLEGVCAGNNITRSDFNNVYHTNIQNSSSYVGMDRTGSYDDGSHYSLGGGISDFPITNLEPGQECIFSYMSNFNINTPEGLFPNLARVNYTDNNGTRYLNQTDDAYVSVMWQTRMISVDKYFYRLYDHNGNTYQDSNLDRPMIKGDIAEFKITINNSGSMNTTLRTINDYVDTSSHGLVVSNITCYGDIATHGTNSTDSNRKTATVTNMVIQPYGNITCYVNFTADQHIVLGLDINYVDVLVQSPHDGWLYWVKDSAAWWKGKPVMEFQKIAETETAHPQENVTYKVIVKNTGTAVADTYLLNDKLPDSFNYTGYNNILTPLTCVSTTPLYCSNMDVSVDSVNPNVPIFTVKNINASCECYFKFNAIVPENVSDGLYKNTMWGSFNDTNNNTYNSTNQTSGDIYITRDIRMLVNKSVNDSFVQPGDYFNFTIDVKNDGNNTLHNVIITDNVPLGISIVSVSDNCADISCTQNSDNNPSNQTSDSVNCSGSIAKNTTCTISIQAYVNTTNTSDAKVPLEGEQCNKVVVTAQVTSTNGGNVNLRETDLACFVVGKPHLAITKWVEGNPTKVAITNVTYYIEIRNTGTADASYIRVYDSLTSNNAWTSGSGLGSAQDPVEIDCPSSWNVSGWTDSGESSSPTFFRPDLVGAILGAGERCLFAYNLTIPNNAMGLYENNATVTGEDFDHSALQNATDEAYVQIVKSGPILNKEVNPKVAQPNDTMTITLTVMNLGDRALTNIHIDDILPIGWNFNTTNRNPQNNGTVVYDGANSYTGCNGGGTLSATSICYNTSTYSSATREEVHCNIPSLCENSRATITFTVYIHDAAVDGANNNFANMSAQDNGGNKYRSNSTNVTTIINNPANNTDKNMQIVKAASKYEVEPGDNLTFTLYIMNPSGATLYNVRIYDVMSHGFDYIDGTSMWNGGNYANPTQNPDNGDVSSQTLNWSISTLMPYSVNILTYIARVGCNISIRNSNYANVSAYTATGETMMNDSTNISIAGGHSNISITKYASNYKPSFFDYVDYTIVIRHNTTWAHVQGLNLTDIIPSGLKYVNGSLRIGNIKVYGTNNESNASQTMFLYDCPSKAAYDSNPTTNCKQIGTINGSSKGTNTTTIFLNLTGYVFLAPWSQIAISYTTQVKPNVGSSPENVVKMWYLDPAHPEISNELSANAAILVPPSLGKENAASAGVTGIVLGNDVIDTIELNQGWNLVAISVMPYNKDVSAVLSSISGKYEAVYAYDDGGWMYNVKVNGNYVGTLKTIESGKGYWIYASEPATLSISGKKVISMDMNLNQGWNLVGYSVQNSKSVDEMASVCDSIFGYDKSWKSASFRYNMVLGDLTSLEKNKGYWIKAKQGTTLAI
ncbi:MAG: hypothetical protein QMD06_00330 [Candidatus Altarchaeum sp.]|nr:hypothetical protein [Candidatus Altarchaeum sp.]